MAGGPYQQVRYFTGNQTGRNHLRASAGKHGSPRAGPSNPPDQMIPQWTAIVFTCPASIAPSGNKTLRHSQSLWCRRSPTATVQLQDRVPTTRARPVSTPAPSSWPCDWFRKEHVNQPVPMTESSGTFAVTSVRKTEVVFPPRAKGKK